MGAEDDRNHHGPPSEGAQGARKCVTLGEQDSRAELMTSVPAPHCAPLTILKPTGLFNREALYELMSDYPEVFRAIIHEFC